MGNFSGMLARSSDISIIFIVNSKIALVFKLNLIAKLNCVFHLDPLCGFRSVESFSIRFFIGNRKPQFAVTRLQFHVAEISNFSEAFSSVHFYLAKIWCNTRILTGIVRLQWSPEETRRFMKRGLSSLKEIGKIKWNSRSDTLIR